VGRREGANTGPTRRFLFSEQRIYMKRTKAILVAITVMFAGLTACTPEEVNLFQSLSPDAQSAVMNHMNTKTQSRDCFEAINKYWPANSKDWAKKITMRESGNNPAAANKRSTARSCMQLLLSYHGWRYEAVGCNASMWKNPDCSIKAALHLYKEAGTSPWKL